MNEFQQQFAKGFQIGLRPVIRNPINNESLTLAQGLVPEDGVLHSIEDITSDIINTSSLNAIFPFPQIFVLSVFTLVCCKDAIYDYTSGNLVLVINGFTQSSVLWSYADFGPCGVLSNSAVTIKRDGISHEWFVVVDRSIPQGQCVSSLNGQLFVGGLVNV
jgi:hypothetical protein